MMGKTIRRYDWVKLRGTLIVLFVFLAAPVAALELPSNDSRSLADNGSKSTAPTISSPEDRETERVVLELVQTHLPELTNVLKRLRTDQPQEYGLAVKDLAKAARKLQLAQNRDQRLFEIELDLFRAQQQASLLMAKLKVRDNQSDRRKLHEAVERLHEAQVARAQYDVDLFRQRLQRTQQQLEGAVSRLNSREDQTEVQVEKTYQSMLRKAGRDTKRNMSNPPQSQDGSVYPSTEPSGAAERTPSTNQSGG